jgi:hypothetical protein
MTRLLRMFIMSMLILYFGLLTTPAWSADAPRDETVILAFSSDMQTLNPHDHTLRLGIITMYHASPLSPHAGAHVNWSACKISR